MFTDLIARLKRDFKLRKMTKNVFVRFNIEFRAGRMEM